MSDWTDPSPEITAALSEIEKRSNFLALFADAAREFCEERDRESEDALVAIWRDGMMKGLHVPTYPERGPDSRRLEKALLTAMKWPGFLDCSEGDVLGWKADIAIALLGDES